MPPLTKAKLQRHFVPGYDRTVPPGHFATASRRLEHSNDSSGTRQTGVFCWLTFSLSFPSSLRVPSLRLPGRGAFVASRWVCRLIVKSPGVFHIVVFSLGRNFRENNYHPFHAQVVMK